MDGGAAFCNNCNVGEAAVAMETAASALIERGVWVGRAVAGRIGAGVAVGIGDTTKVGWQAATDKSIIVIESRLAMLTMPTK
jgi:hypothetical protein